MNITLFLLLIQRSKKISSRKQKEKEKRCCLMVGELTFRGRLREYLCHLCWWHVYRAKSLLSVRRWKTSRRLHQIFEGLFLVVSRTVGNLLRRIRHDVESSLLILSWRTFQIEFFLFLSGHKWNSLWWIMNGVRTGVLTLFGYLFCWCFFLSSFF